MTLQIWQHRHRLKNTLKALQQGEVTVGFIGGSITDERPGHNWPEGVLGYLVNTFPEVRFSVENAGIGATGSDFGALRVKRDLIDRECDLVFVEFAVNDLESPTERRNRTREGLLRQLLQQKTIDVILVYTFSQDMYAEMIEDVVPSTVAELEILAEYYRLNSVWMGLYALEEVKAGMMKWEEWLPDGLHPTHRGSYSYAQSVIKLLSEALAQEASSPVNATAGDFPAPLNQKHWTGIETLLFSKVKLEGPWTIRRSTRLTWADQILETNAIGAKLFFNFKGNVVMLVFDFGRHSSEFRYRIDGAEWIEMERERPDWVGDSGWLKLELLSEDLEDSDHQFELEVIHGNRSECRGTNFRLTAIGTVSYEVEGKKRGVQ